MLEVSHSASPKTKAMDFKVLMFYKGVKAALLSAKLHASAGSCQGGIYPQGDTYRTWTDDEKKIGLKAFGRVYAGWGFSQSFYRERLYETVMGCKDLEDFMQNFWGKWALSKGMLYI
jgi:homoserine O-acetyltransferase